MFGPLVGSVLVEHRRFSGDRGDRLGDSTYRRLQAWQLAGLVLGVLAARWLPGAAMPGPDWLWPVLGCLVGIAGVVLRWWAIRVLGTQFTRELRAGDDHRLVDVGPYRHLRHPSYTGAILMLAGVGIGLGNVLSLAACVVLPTIGYVQRIGPEETLLRDRLGESYAAYAARTRRLLPGLW